MTVPILHTVYQQRPDRTYVLHDLKYSVIDGVWGLGLPPMTTQDELVLERGVFQHGSTLTVVRLPPTREFVLSFKLKQDCSLADYYNARRELIDIFNPIHLANGQTSGPAPSLYTYWITLPDGRKYGIRFAYRSGLDFDEQDAPDHRSFNLKVRLMSPDVTLFEDFDYIEILGNTSPVGGPYTDLLNTGSPFVYSGSWPARFQAIFRDTGAPSVGTIYALILRDVTNSFSYVFAHQDYPAGGWTPAGVVMPQTFTFDSRVGQEVFEYEDASPQTINLTLASRPNSDWRDFQFYPGIEYELYLETSSVQLVSGVVADGRGLIYRPTHIGI
jgi:hypothetical protein